VEQADGRRYRYRPDFKREAVDRMMAGESVSSLAKQLGVRNKFLYQWREAGYGSAGPQPPIRIRRQKAQPPEGSAVEWQAATAKNRIAELERLVGRLPQMPQTAKPCNRPGPSRGGLFLRSWPLA
jgi:transposase-like protein